MNHLPDLPTRAFVWLAQLKLASHSLFIMAEELYHTHETKERALRGATSPSLIREILLFKEALASIQFAAIIAIKKAFSLLPHLTSQLMHSPKQWWGGC